MAAIPMRFGSSARTLILLVVLLGAAGLRFAGRNWDAGHHLHPDERFLSMVVAAEGWPESLEAYLDEARSRLNPRNVGYPFFAYGTLPTTVVTGVGAALGHSELQGFTLVGRAASATASLGTVLLVFLIARRLYGDDRIAVLAASLMATAVLPIQHAHFFVVDPFAVVFITAAIWALAGPPRVYRYPLVGLFFGLALACKLSVVTFAAVVGTAALAEVFGPAAPRRVAWSTFRRLSLVSVQVVTMLAAAFAAFRLAQPDAFQGPGLLDVWPSARWLDNLAAARQLVNGSTDTPPGVQWADRTPYWFAWKHLVVWGLGPALGLTAWVAWGVGTWQAVSRRTTPHLIPVLWTGILFLHQGGQFVMTGRYLLPLYPMLALLAAWLLVRLWDRAAARDAQGPAHWRKTVAGSLAAVVLLTTALWGVAFTAIYRRPNTRVAASEWLYRNVPAGTTLAVEHWDDALPVSLEGRSPGNYNRLVLPLYDDDTPEKLDSVLRWLEETEYLILASNRLYDSIPRLPMRYPMTIRYYEALFSGELGFERAADFTSYPSLGLLQFPDQSAEEAFSVYDHARVQVFRKTPRWSASRARALVGDVDWSGVIRLPAVRARGFGTGLMLSARARADVREGGTWSLIFNADGTANTWPILTWVLALELLGLAAFPLATLALGRLPDRGWLLAKGVGLLVLGYGAWLSASLRWFPFTRNTIAALLVAMAAASLVVVWRQRSELRRFWAARRSLLMKEECLFWVCFVGFLMIRAGNPDLWHPFWGGEKPMDFAYLNAVVRSEYFPPYDPWFAGGYLNYYYFGFVLVGLLIKLTAVVPEVAYNLAVPTFFALTAAATFSVVHALVSSTGPADSEGSSPAGAGSSAFAYGVVGVVFVAVLGNLAEVRLLFRTLVEGRWAEAPLWSWYWDATRAIPHAPTEAPPITEFPFFTFLYGDLHAHAMGLPFTILVLALVICLVLPPSDGSRPPSEAWPFGLLALTLGALFPLNAWDYPTYAWIVGVSLLMRAWLRRAPGDAPGHFAGRAFVQFVAVLIAGRVLFAPFFAHYGQAYGGFTLWSGSRTSLSAYMVIHGLFLFIITSAVLALAAARFRFLRRRPSGAAAVALAGVFAATAVLLTIVVEFVVLDGDIGRMNTVFKFYFQAWVLLSIAAATSLAALARAWADRPATRGPRFGTLVYAWTGIALWLTLSAALYPVLATWARLQDRFESDAGVTLNGQAFMRTAVHSESGTAFPLRPDLEAINWLRAAIAGTPVIVEAHAPEYRWGSRISVHTGLPTIVGWRHHQTQQRAVLPADVVTRRVDDVSAIYSSPEASSVTAILDRYQVEYIYVGPLERILYAAEGLAKFDSQSPYWRTVYQQDQVRIYQVER